MTAPPLAAPVPGDDSTARIEAATRAALVAHLLRAGVIAEIAHFALIVAAAVLVWERLPDVMVIGWVVAVLAATITRALVRREAVVQHYAADRALRVTRLTVAGLSLAWGVGAAVAMTELPLVQLALLLVVLTGLVAGATTTLTSDRPSFFLFSTGILAPLPVGILMNGQDRDHFYAVFLVAFYGVLMAAQLSRAHRTLVEYFRAQVRLRENEATAVRERTYLDALIDNAPIAIVTADPAGKIHRVNAAFERLFGYAAGDAVGRDLDSTIVPPGDETLAAELRRRVTSGTAVNADVRRRRKDGTLIDVRVSASRVEGGGDAELFALYEDVTAQVAARRAIEDARDAAEHAAHARATFLANMSHEIRTPMNAILGFTELLLESELSAEQRHSLALVQTSAETLLTLIDDILDFSKIEGDHLQLESIVFDLPHLVESTAGLLGVRAREKRLEVLAHIAEGSPTAVHGDPTRLRQVLTNLIGNAIKFTHAGEVVVSVMPAGRDNGRARVRFSVRDTGIGIPADKLDTIFGEFTQADASMTRRYGGTGLGLAIARRLVRLMGGDLTVQSEEGKGTEFTFSLPFEVDDAPPAPVHPGAAYLAGRRALVVDDNETNRRIVREMLSSAGMRVSEADRGGPALDILRRARDEGKMYDLVILDQQMPDLDGFSAAAMMRDDPVLRETRILMLTSAGQRGDGQRCRELGIRGYLTKPTSRSELIEAAAAVLSAGAAGEAVRGDVVTRHSIAESRPRLRILLAEDNPVNQEVAATILRRRGHQVQLVADGRAAVAAFGAGAFDVVLMDIQMPLMDGFEATAAIRALPAGRELPIIALTAHAQRGERERCLAQGMSGFLTKPFKAHDLFAVVEGWDAALTPTDAAPTAAAPATSAVDIEAFRRSMREAGAEDAVPAILSTFQSTAPGRLADLETAVGAGVPADVQRAAHAYKSAAATIGARELARLLGELESAARGGDVTGAAAALAAIHAAHTAVVNELSQASLPH